MVRILFPPAVSQANFRLAPLARPDLVERQPELLAHHLTAAGDIEASPSHHLRSSCRGPRLLPCTRATRSRLRRPSVSAEGVRNSAAFASAFSSRRQPGVCDGQEADHRGTTP